MIKAVTKSGTTYIIDKDQGRIKRIPSAGKTFDSILRGFINVGEFQPYNWLDGLEIDSKLRVEYPNEQQWSISTTIVEIDYGYEEDSEYNFEKELNKEINNE